MAGRSLLSREDGCTRTLKLLTKWPEDLSFRVEMAIFPGMREGNVHSFNESGQGWSLREANV